MALGRAAFLNSLYMVIGNGSQLIASLGVFLYLAHILKPADFGAMGVAAAIVDLLTVFGRFGQVEALLESGVEKQQARSTSFWLLVAIGVINFLVIAAMAQPLAFWTGTPVVAPVLLLLAAVPLIQNLGQVNEAMLRHEMRYGGIAARNATSTVASAGVAVLLAMSGFGVYALAGQKLAFTLVYTLAVWIAKPWRADSNYVRDDARRLMATGFNVTISNTLQMANGRIVDLNIGLFLGTVALGVTRVAWRLYDFSLQLVIAPLSSVSYSLFTRVRENPQELQRTYLQYMELIVLIALPVFIGVSIVSRDAILFLAGPKWESSAVILSLLSLTVMASCISLIFNPIMVATSRTELIRRQAMWQTATNVIVTVVAAQFSVLAVVAGYLARSYMFAFINLLLMNNILGVRMGTFLSRLAPIVLATGVLAVTALLIRTLLGAESGLLRLLCCAAGGSVAYGATLILGDRIGLWPGLAKRLAALASSVLRRGKTGDAKARP